MKRPLFLLTCFYIIGIILGRYMLLNSIAFFLIPVTLIVYFLYKKYKWSGSVLFILFFIMGYIFSYNKFSYKNKYIEDIITKDEEVYMKGVVKKKTITPNDKTKVIVSVTDTITKDYKINSNFNMVVYFSSIEDISIGESLTIKGKILELDEQRNIGGYSEKNSLLTKNIRYKSFSSLHARNGIEKSFLFELEKLRIKLINVYDKVLPEKEAGTIKAMILGHEDDLDESVKELYSIAGIYHIISISGTHISILTLFIISILKQIFSSKFSKIITMIFLIIYCIFTGGNPSIVRATIMGCTILVGDVLYREKDLLTTLALSTLIVLLYNPSILWSLSFQLSYGCILGLTIFTEPVYRMLMFITRDKYFRFREIIFNLFSSSIAVQIIITPIIAFHLFKTNPYSPIANIPLFFTANLLIISGFIVGLIGLLNINLAIFLSGIVYYILKLYDLVTSIIYKLPLSNILIGRPRFIYILIYIGIFSLVLYYFSTYDHDFKSFKRYLSGLTIVFLATLFIDMVIPKDFELTMIDVGQGDCTVVNYKKTTFVIDGGKNGYTLNNYLNYKGIGEIEGVFISHTDFDHAGGIIDILYKKKIKNLFLPKMDYKNDEIYEEIINLAGKTNINVHFITSDDIIKFDENLSFNCISPVSNSSFDNNNSSIVLKMNYEDVSCLFTGDIEKIAEEDILSRNINIKSDILKVSHHGSKTSTSQEFLDQVNPSISLIGVGRNNGYGHPNSDVLDRLSNSNSNILRTDLSGDIKILMKNGTFIINRTLN